MQTLVGFLTFKDKYTQIIVLHFVVSRHLDTLVFSAHLFNLSAQ